MEKHLIRTPHNVVSSLRNFNLTGSCVLHPLSFPATFHCHTFYNLYMYLQVLPDDSLPETGFSTEIVVNYNSFLFQKSAVSHTKCKRM